jgi:hypothetical protein
VRSRRRVAARRSRPLRSAHPILARPRPGADLDRGQRQHRPVVQPVAVPVLEAEPDFPEQRLMAGYDANQITIAAIVIASRLRGRACSTGATASSRCAGRRSSATG